MPWWLVCRVIDESQCSLVLTETFGILPRIRTSPWLPIGTGPCRSTQAARDLAQHQLRR